MKSVVACHLNNNCTHKPVINTSVKSIFWLLNLMILYLTMCNSWKKVTLGIPPELSVLFLVPLLLFSTLILFVILLKLLLNLSLLVMTLVFVVQTLQIFQLNMDLLHPVIFVIDVLSMAVTVFLSVKNNSAKHAVNNFRTCLILLKTQYP